MAITRHGRPEAVLISVEDLESLEETLDILSDRATMANLKEAENSAERSTLEEVAAELRANGRLR